MTTATATATDRFGNWSNWQTWNVALWLQNDEALYKVARQFTHYDSLIPYLESGFGQMTPDGARWMDPTIDTAALDKMLTDL